MFYSGSRRREWLTHLIFHLVCPFNHKLQFENAHISMRLGLPSTPIRSAFSSKTHRFENALEGGSKRKRIHILLLWTVENASIKTMTENIAGACEKLEHAHRVQLTSQRAILSFSNILVWTVKNASKRKCGHYSIDAFSMTAKTH